MSCDFDIEQRVIAIGLKDGIAKTMDIEKLCITDVFTYGNDPEYKQPSVTAINCRIKEKVIAGYEDGFINEFSVNNPTQPTNSIPPLKTGSSMLYSPVAHIEYSGKKKLIIASYNMSKESSTILSYEIGSTSIFSTINHSSGSVIGMRVLEWAQALVTLSNFKNEIGIYDYTSGTQLISLHVEIKNITYHNPITSFALLPLTKQVRLKYEGLKTILKNETQGDIIAFGMVNGSILTAYLSLKFDKGKVMASIIPQQLYKSKLKDIYESSIISLYIDSATDNVVAGDAQGNVIMLDRVVMQILNPDKAKQPIVHDKINTEDKSSGSRLEPIVFEMVDRKKNEDSKT